MDSEIIEGFSPSEALSETQDWHEDPIIRGFEGPIAQWFEKIHSKIRLRINPTRRVSRDSQVSASFDLLSRVRKKIKWETLSSLVWFYGSVSLFLNLGCKLLMALSVWTQEVPIFTFKGRLTHISMRVITCDKRANPRYSPRSRIHAARS